MSPQDPGSLENLRDIVEPDPVAWWPPAPGWWILLAILGVGLLVIAIKTVQRWRANAYRRAALAELTIASSDAAIVELLKRTAIGSGERSEVGSLSGDAWCQLLSQTSNVTIPPIVTERISVGVYRNGSELTPELSEFAHDWIVKHTVIKNKVEEHSEC